MIRTRREILAVLGVVGLGTIASACTRSSDAPARTPSVGSLDALEVGATQISMVGPSTQVNPGKQTYSFFLVNGQAVITGASPSLWLAKDKISNAAGPFPATWLPLLGHDKTDDRSPASPLAVGIYSAEVDFPSAGTWTLAAHVASPRSAVGTQAVQVVDSDIVAALGSKAIAVPTPVATSRHGLAEICTRTPPDPMHYISLDDALRNGKPSVVSFATPLLCESKMCGPVVDEQLLVFEHYGADRANFIHVEEFLPGPDLQPTNSVSPAFRAWRFIDEPWVIVIDGAGEIRARLGPGVTAAAQIDAALSPLL